MAILHPPATCPDGDSCLVLLRPDPPALPKHVCYAVVMALTLQELHERAAQTDGSPMTSAWPFADEHRGRARRAAATWPIPTNVGQRDERAREHDVPRLALPCMAVDGAERNEWLGLILSYHNATVYGLVTARAKWGYEFGRCAVLGRDKQAGELERWYNKRVRGLRVDGRKPGSIEHDHDKARKAYGRTLAYLEKHSIPATFDRIEQYMAYSKAGNLPMSHGTVQNYINRDILPARDSEDARSLINSVKHLLEE